MTIKDIQKKCDEIACNPNENQPSDTLNNLVRDAKILNYALAFHIGHDLLSKPYIQGYTLEPMDAS